MDNNNSNSSYSSVSFNNSYTNVIDEETIFKYVRETIEYVLSREHITVFFPHVNTSEGQDVVVSYNELINLPLVYAYAANDKNLIYKVLSENKKFSVDLERDVVTIYMNKRTTIMLRDIPENAKKEEILELFGDFAKNILDMKPEIGDNYYVEFDNAENTQNAFVYVRKQTFRTNPVQCCIKSNYNYYSSPIYVPQETFNPDLFSGKGKKPRGRGGSNRGKKPFNPNHRNFNNINRGGKFNNNKPRNEGPREEYFAQDFGGESFPPLRSTSNQKESKTDLKKYTKQQIFDIVANISEVHPPKWENQSLAISENKLTELEFGKYLPTSKNIDWIDKKFIKKKKKGRSTSFKKDEIYEEDNNNNKIGSTTTQTKHYKIKDSSKQNIQTDKEKSDTNNHSTPLYADIVKQNVESPPQTKSPTTTPKSSIKLDSPKEPHNKDSPKEPHKDSPKETHIKDTPKETHKDSPKDQHKDSPKESQKENHTNQTTN